MEPYPTPNLIEQDLAALLKVVSFVDKIIFGRTNYNTEVSHYHGLKNFYNDCVATVIAFCESYGIDYHIKLGTTN